MNLGRRRHLAVALSLAGLVLEHTAQGAESSADLEALLDESIVTTASKSTETGTAAPATSTSITAEELRRYGIHSLDEAIDFLSLGVVTANPLRDVDIGSRGVLLAGDRGNHLLLLINGHALNEPLYGGAHFDRGAAVPFELIDHVEVIIGPGSVLYGSSAMFGVVNVITKRAKDFAGTHVVGETEIAKSYRGGAGAGYRLGKDTAFTLALEYYSQKGPTFTFGPQDFGSDPVTSVGTITRNGGPTNGIWGGPAKSSYYSVVPAALARFQSGGLEVSVHASSFKRSAPYAASLSPVPGDFDYPDNYDIDRRLWADVAYRTRLSTMFDVSARVYGDWFDNQKIYTSSSRASCIYSDGNPCRYQWTGISRWIGSEVQSSINWLPDASLVTMIGADARVLGVVARQDVQNALTLAYRESSTNVIDGSEAVLGAYLQQTWKPTAYFSFNAGARLDASARYSAVPSPRLAANVGAWTGGTLKVIYAEAFRAPSWNEAESKNINLLKADELKPEGVRSIEAVLEQKLGTQRLLFGVFRSWWRNLVELHRISRAEYDKLSAEGKLDSLLNFSAQQYRNVASIDNYGLNARVEGSVGTGSLRYAVNGTAAFTKEFDPEFGSAHVPTVTPQLFGNARISYDFGGPYPTLALAGHYLGKRPPARAFEKIYAAIPYAPPQVELRATVSGGVPYVTGLSYWVSADYAFADKGSYIVGRTLTSAGTVLASPSPQLVPVDTFRTTVGLQLDFLP